MDEDDPSIAALRDALAPRRPSIPDPGDPSLQPLERVRQFLESRRTERAVLALFGQIDGLIEQDSRLAEAFLGLASRVGDLEMTVRALTDEVAELRRDDT